MSIEVTAGKIPIRTKKDGVWKKYTYQDLEWSVTLSGLLTFDEANWTGWDMLDNQFNFSHVLARVSFEDGEGNIRTLQGYVMIETATLSYSPGQLVKDDFQMQGNGKMDIFDGLIPCDTAITDISISGQTAEDGIVHFDYTFTGPVHQVKYRIDDMGDYAYATAGPTIDVAGLTIGNHIVEIIPVCINNYEGIGREERFQITQGNTCSSTIDSITVDTSAFTIINTHSGAATQMRYRIDGGAWIDALISATISISSLDPGDHSIEEVPVCANGVEGTGMTQDFTIISQPALSKINWNYTPATIHAETFSIYVNGVLIENDTNSGSGFFMAPIGATIRTVLYGPKKLYASHLNLQISDITTATDLYLHSTNIPVNGTGTEQFIFTTTGDEYQINGSVTIP